MEDESGSADDSGKGGDASEPEPWWRALLANTRDDFEQKLASNRGELIWLSVSNSTTDLGFGEARSEVQMLLSIALSALELAKQPVQSPEQLKRLREVLSILQNHDVVSTVRRQALLLLDKAAKPGDEGALDAWMDLLNGFVLEPYSQAWHEASAAGKRALAAWKSEHGRKWDFVNEWLKHYELEADTYPPEVRAQWPASRKKAWNHPLAKDWLAARRQLPG